MNIKEINLYNLNCIYDSLKRKIEYQKEKRKNPILLLKNDIKIEDPDGPPNPFFLNTTSNIIFFSLLSTFMIYKYMKRTIKITIKESELVKLIETAMDTDIYNQTMDTPASTPNEDESDSIETVIERLKELLSMLKTGKK